MQLRSIYGIAALACALCCTSADAQSGGAYLGAELGPLAPELAKRFGGGVLILGVMPGSPATSVQVSGECQAKRLPVGSLTAVSHVRGQDSYSPIN